MPGAESGDLFVGWNCEGRVPVPKISIQEEEKSPEWKKVRNTPAVGGRAPPFPSQRALIRRIWPSRATFDDWAPAVSGGGASHSGQGGGTIVMAKFTAAE